MKKKFSVFLMRFMLLDVFVVGAVLIYDPEYAREDNFIKSLGAFGILYVMIRIFRYWEIQEDSNNIKKD